VEQLCRLNYQRRSYHKFYGQREHQYFYQLPKNAAHSGFYENALYKFTFTYLLTKNKRQITENDSDQE